MNNSLEKRISNYEEIRPKHQKSEMPLVAFTLLVQIAIGMFWMVLLTYYLMPNKHNMGQIIFMPMLFSEICIFCALVISFLHLGTPKNAWKIIYHLQKSWLSREILSVVAFAAFGFLTTYWGGLVYGNISMRYSFYGLMHWDLVKHCFTGELLCNFIYPSILPFYWLASITFCIGILSTFSMAKVYRLHVMPAWDTWRTTVGFFVTAILLGQLAMNNLLGGSRLAWGVVVAALAFELALVLSAKPKAEGLGTSIRVGLSAAGMLGAGIMLFASNPIGVWVSPVLFLLVMIEEVIGRVQFYTVLDEKPL
jgi:anaerobic dimethyl sulfoxide reductase subunit C (anchor subunit)